MTLEELRDIKSIIDRDLNSGNREDILSLVEYINERLNNDKEALLEENFVSFISRNLSTEELSNLDVNHIMRSATSIKGIYPYDFRVKDFLGINLEELVGIIGKEKLDIILHIFQENNLYNNLNAKRTR